MPEFPIPSASCSFGTTVNAASTIATGPTTSGSSNTKGSWTELIAATPFAAGFAIVQIQAGSTAGYLVDIGIGGSGSEQIIIADLQLTQRNAICKSYEFPVFIPAGTRIAARAQDDTGLGVVVPVKITLLGSALPCSTVGMVSSYGATASSKGTNVDPGAVAHTKSSWVEIAAATNRQHNWMVLSVVAGDNSVAASGFWLLDIGIGAGGSEQVLVSDLVIGMDSAQDWETFILTLPLSVPVGSRLSVRAQALRTTDGDRDLYVKLYGC